MSPTNFFAKEVLSSWRGIKCVTLAAIWGIVSGAILPLTITRFFSSIGTPAITQTASQLIGIIIFINLLASYQERKSAYLVNQLKHERRKLLAEALRISPYANTNGAAKTIIARFRSAQTLGMWMVVDEAVKLSAALLSFIALLTFNHMPWWLYIVVAIVIAIAISAYWSIKKFVLFKIASDLESETGDVIAELCEARNNQQVQPALVRAAMTLSQKAFVARAKASYHTITRYQDTRNAINAVVCTAAVILAAMSNNPATAVLLVIFMFTFSSHIMAIHRLASNVDSIESDGQPLLNITAKPAKPLLTIKPTDTCLRTSKVTVRYPGKGDKPDTLVSIDDYTLQKGGIYVFTGVNGKGKSSLFKAIAGEAEYSGELLLWGQQASDFDCSHVINAFQQKRQNFSPTVQDLFYGDESDNFYHDEAAMHYALRCVNALTINREQLHRELSGGQLQKIDLALLIYRSIVKNNEIGLIVIDEPTNNFDRDSIACLQENLVKFVIEYVGPEVTMLIATHEQELQKTLLLLPRSYEIE